MLGDFLTMLFNGVVFLFMTFINFNLSFLELTTPSLENGTWHWIGYLVALIVIDGLVIALALRVLWVIYVFFEVLAPYIIGVLVVVFGAFGLYQLAVA